MQTLEEKKNKQPTKHKPHNKTKTTKNPNHKKTGQKPTQNSI